MYLKKVIQRKRIELMNLNNGMMKLKKWKEVKEEEVKSLEP